MRIYITVALITVLSLLRNVCSATGNFSPNTTQSYRFPCGRDRCTINYWYCDEGRSDDPEQWICSPCTEIDQWCETDIALVPRDCLGYCEAKKWEASMKRLKSKCRELYQAEDESGRHNAAVPRSVEPLNGLEKFLVENKIVVMCVFGLLIIIIVGGLLAHTLRQCRRNRMAGGADGDTELGAGLMGSQPDSHDPQPTVVKTTGTQTDSTGLLGSAGTHKHQVEFVQPINKGAHGIRLLNGGTVAVDNDGKDCTEDTSFLNLDHQPISPMVTNLS